jgi:putative oxidoreductase
MNMLSGLFAFVGRIMLASLFITMGAYRLGSVDSSNRYMADISIPANLTLPIGLFELIGGLMIALGIFTRLMSVLFVGVCLLTALLLQREVPDPMRVEETLKHVAIAGGFMCLFAYEGKAWSLDNYRARRRAEAGARIAATSDHPATGAG